MKAKLLISFVAATLFSLSAHALDCSGGANGGMDATGNQCNDVAAVATPVSTDNERLPAARLPKGEANRADLHSENAAKRTAATPHTSSRLRIKNS